MKHGVLVFAGFLTSVVSVSEVAAKPGKELVTRNARSAGKRRKWVVPAAVATAVLLAGAGVGGGYAYHRAHKQSSPGGPGIGSGQNSTRSETVGSALAPKASSEPSLPAGSDPVASSSAASGQSCAVYLKFPGKEGNSDQEATAMGLSDVLRLTPEVLAQHHCSKLTPEQLNNLFFKQEEGYKQKIKKLLSDRGIVPARIFFGFAEAPYVKVLLFVDQNNTWVLIDCENVDEITRDRLRSSVTINVSQCSTNPAEILYNLRADTTAPALESPACLSPVAAGEFFIVQEPRKSRLRFFNDTYWGFDEINTLNLSGSPAFKESVNQIIPLQDFKIREKMVSRMKRAHFVPIKILVCELYAKAYFLLIDRRGRMMLFLLNGDICSMEDKKQMNEKEPWFMRVLMSAEGFDLLEKLATSAEDPARSGKQ